MADPRVVVLSDSDRRRVVSFSEQSAGYSDREDDDSQEVVISPKGSICESAGEEEPSSPDIGQVSTFDSSSAAEDYDKQFTRNVRQATDEAKSRRRWSLTSSLRSTRRTEVLDRLSDALKEASHHDDHFDFSLFGSWEDLVSQVFYISMFSVFGTVLRIFMGRIFGLDCQLKNAGTGADDFLTPFSSRICITSDGKTQPGSLFVDLPANILGSFLMGIISPVEDGHPLPWFRRDHPLQSHRLFHIGLKVGFCGCLTTFASWNTQMVVMLDGTATELGPQVAPALFGYMIGVACAVSSFIFGRHANDWLRSLHPPVVADVEYGITPPPADVSLDLNSCHSSGIESQLSRFKEGVDIISKLYKIKYGPLFFTLALLIAFAVVDAKQGLLFYRKLWMSCLLAPFGAVLRWRISVLNKRNLRWARGFMWIPWGTFFANLLASIISLAAEAVNSQVLDPEWSGYDWMSPALLAVEGGFAGSLSTVSTLMREMFSLDTPAQAHIYCLFTIVSSMLCGLLVYSPIMRYY